MPCNSRRRLAKRGFRYRILLTVLYLLAVAGRTAGELAAPPPKAGIFTDIAAETGLDFVHFNGMTGKLYYSEVMGSGAALFDFDNDGDLDIYLVQGNLLAPEETLAQALFPPGDEQQVGDRLWRNDLRITASGERVPRFTDVTEESGIDARGYGMGVATGDYDNDGWVDLYVTNLGPNQLWHNDGAGADGRVTFTDVTADTGSGDPRWSTSATFADFDRDGWVDLYVANYIGFDATKHKPCYGTNSALVYCGPDSYPPVPDLLLRNRGAAAGRIAFEDRTAEAGIARAPGAGLGVVASDFDGDGRLDIFVANDASENQLWHNRGDGTFENLALMAGCAVNMQGRAEAGMGIGVADFDDDGDEDLFLAHLSAETNTLYRNDGNAFFEDATIALGLALPSVPFTSFGTGWLDFDNDSDLDLLIVSGAINPLPSLVLAGDPFPLHQVNQLWRNPGNGALEGRFEEVGGEAGSALELSEVSRGAAFGDLDNDGDVDVVVTNNNGPVRLLRNNGHAGHHWLGLRLVDSGGQRDLLGTRVAVLRPRRPTLFRRSHSDGSYCSASDPRVLVGLGAESAPVRVQVEWPDGAREQFAGLPIDAYATLRQGGGGPIGAEHQAAVEPMAAESGGQGWADVLARWPVAEPRRQQVPAPILENLEPAVDEQLRRQRAELDRLLAGDAGDHELVAAFGAMGRLYHTYKYFDAAAACYQNLRYLAPRDFTWPYYLGHLELAGGEGEAAVVSFERVLEIAPGYLPARVWSAKTLFQLGWIEEARTRLNEVLRRDPGFASAHTVLGQIAATGGDHATAAAHYAAVLELQPAATQVHYQLALAYRGLGQPRKAAAHMARRGGGRVSFPDPLLKDLEALNRSSRFFVERGEHALLEGRYRDAAIAFRQALVIKPAAPTARINLGSAFAHQGADAAALAQYLKVLVLDPRHPTAHFNAGALLSERGDLGAAIDHYRAAIQADPDHQNAHFNLANALRRRGAWEEAASHYARVVALAPANTSALLGEIRCLAARKRHREALLRAEDGHRKFPADRPVADALARLLATSSNEESRDGPRALRLAEDNFAAGRVVDYVETLAMAHAEVGDFAQAITWQQRAVRVARRTGHLEAAADMGRVLEGYRHGRPCRRPWRQQAARQVP